MWLGVIFGYAVAVLTIFVIHWIYKWRNPRGSSNGGVLPPGSMGWPLIGETLHLLIPSRSLDLHPFIKKRIQRYGSLFRTSLAGRPVIISTDAEVNHYLFLQEGRSVEMWYLDTFAKLFNLDGDSKPTAFGAVHRYVRSIVLNHFGPDTLREKLLPQIEQMIDSTLGIWSLQGSVPVKEAVATMVFDCTAKQMIGYDPQKSSDKLSEKFTSILQGLMSFPLNIPGTAFHKCLKELDSSVISKNFMPFGGGMRQCAGAEFTRAFMATFFHVLVTKYRWKKIKGGNNFGRTPFLDFGDGIHIKFSEKA